MILDSGKTSIVKTWRGCLFESVVILDSGKTDNVFNGVRLGLRVL